MRTVDEKIDDAIDSLKNFQQLAKMARMDLEELKKERRKASVELTNVQAARMLDVSEATIRRMKNDGRLESTNFLEVFNYSKS